jgi:cytidylate kinase
MYRAVALFGLDQKLLDDREKLAAACRTMDLRFDWSLQPARVLLEGRDVSEAIRRPEVTAVAYIAADNLGVRTNLVERQREIGRQTALLVTEGRDQGSIVFPKAEFKFYLDAKPEERARRRIAQLAQSGIASDPAEVLRLIVERDARDKARPVGGLVQTDDAIVLDTSPLTLQEVVDRMFQLVTQTPTAKAPKVQARP